MTKHDVGVLASRLLAIYGAFLTLQVFAYSSTLSVYRYTIEEGREVAAIFLFVYVVGLAAIAGVSLFLWVGAERVASAMFPGGDTGPAATTATLQDIQAIAFSAVGLLLLVRAIPRLTEVVIQFLWLPRNQQLAMVMSAYRMAGVGASVAEIVLGLWLVFGPRWWARLINALRTGGSEQPPSQ